MALIGPNGSGKSTLLRCIDGILKPKAGQIFIDGQDTGRMDPTVLARHLAYVPQSETSGFPVNVFETILMGRKPHMAWIPSEADLQKTAAVIEQLHLNDLALTKINQLSGGQRQKVLIGRALVQDSALLLLDEPTASLDLKHQLEVLDLLKMQTQKGISVIIAIHDLNLAVRYCNKLILLNQGEIFAAGGAEIINEANLEAVYEVKVSIMRNNRNLIIIPETTVGEKIG